MFSRCDTDFELGRHLIPFLQEIPFFAELSRQIRKTPTQDPQMPTAAISFNPKTDELELFWNPDFFKSMTNWEIKGVLTHEFYHLIFGHLGTRRKTPPRLWNIATDLAINSIIFNNAKDTMPKDASPGDEPLPKCVLLPGRAPKHPDGRDLTKEEKEASALAGLIEKLPLMHSSEFYFTKLLEAAKQQQQKMKGPGGEGGEGSGDPGDDELFGSFDVHDLWDVPEEMREYIDHRVKAIIEKAVKYADSHPQGWGNMPQDLVADIRASVSQIVDWRAVLRQFVGSLIRGNKTSSIKRINKRYPYIHPGTKRAYQAKLLIAMDQSGSVPNDMVEMFFGELRNLTKRVGIEVIPFDAEAHVQDVFAWNRGQTPKMKRSKCGGTDFNAPTHVFNDPKNRGRWDGLLIMTDGECSPPIPARGKRGWVLGKGHKLMFDSNELQIHLDDTNKVSGAWR